MGALLVAIQSAVGFWRFKPISNSGFYLAVVASVIIPLGFLKKWAWARGAAMLVAIFGVFGELGHWDGPGTKLITFVLIAFYTFLFVWLRRTTVRMQFALPTQAGKIDERA